MDSPPPYTPHPENFHNPESPATPSAPTAPELYPDISQQMDAYQQQQQLQQIQQQMQQQQQQQQFISSVQITAVQPANPIAQATSPLRMKCGHVDVGSSLSNDIELLTSFSRHYVEVKDGVMRLASNRASLNKSVSVPLAQRYVSIEKKRLVVVQGNDGLYALRTNNELQSYQWLNALSQFCFVAPSMEGYGYKYSKGSKKFEERFFRLGSDGILSWFQTDSDGSDRQKGIQVRGETFNTAPANPDILTVQLLLKGKEYKFRFSDGRMAALWLAAFRWHSHRKPFRHPYVSILNKAK